MQFWIGKISLTQWKSRSKVKRLMASPAFLLWTLAQAIKLVLILKLISSLDTEISIILSINIKRAIKSQFYIWRGSWSHWFVAVKLWKGGSQSKHFIIKIHIGIVCVVHELAISKEPLVQFSKEFPFWSLLHSLLLIGYLMANVAMVAIISLNIVWWHIFLQ